MSPGPSDRLQRFVLTLALLALAALAGNLLALAAEPPSAGASVLWAGLVFVAGFLLLERSAVPFVWRNHRVTTDLTETAVFLGFLHVAPPLLVLLVPLSRVGVQLATRRPPIKGVFNISHGVLSTAVGAGAFAASAALGAHPLLSATLGTVAYSVTSELTTASLFTRLESVVLATIYRERFLLPQALSLTLGIPAAFVLLGLHALHPLALLAAVPFVFMVLRHAGLQARADRELAAHRRLAVDAQDLVGARDEESIARRVLRSTIDLLNASRAQLRLSEGATWEDEYDDLASPHRRPPSLEVPVVGRDGRVLGTLVAWERAGKGAFGEAERALLQIIAGQAAHGFESARALAEAAAQRDTITRQEKLSALGTLMAGVAHEINNPLSYMRLRVATADMATRAVLEDPLSANAQAYAEKMAKNLEVIARGLERLGQLSHSLKAVARPGDGERRATDVNDVVTQVLTVLQAAHRETRYQVDLAPNLPLALANAAELHQVVLNLVKNAAEALEGHPDPRIRIATWHDEGQVRVLVQDNGPGIPADARPRLFMPFFTTKKTGTGLGLSVSHQIVTAHGGELRLETEPGGGATFTMRLPMAPRETAGLDAQAGA